MLTPAELEHILLNAMQNLQAGRQDVALALFEAALAQDAYNTFALYGVIPLLIQREHYEQAHHLAKRLTDLDAAQHEAWTLRCMAARQAADFEDAIWAGEQAYSHGAGPGMLSVMGGVQLGRGRAREAIELFDRALQDVPNNDVIHSNRLFAMTCCPGISREELAQAHFAWGRRLESRVHYFKKHKVRKNSHRKIKVGYVSADFHHHPVVSLIEPILQHHNRDQFELHSFDNQKGRGDAVTQRLRSYFDHWHYCAQWDDATMAKIIYDLEIDVLVDLSGHTAGNRLSVFAMQPAPAQVTWFGYMCTTGLTRMNYRFTDLCHSPEGDDFFYSEKLYRLSTISPWLPHGDSPEVGEIPALNNGYVTFGAFNRWDKVTEQAIVCWSKILLRCDKSKLRIVVSETLTEALKQTIEVAFLKLGIGTERLLLSGKTRLSDFLAIINTVDIALDTFPYNGGTTSAHTLWMGVPIVSLKSDNEFGRAGFALLSSVGLSNLCVESVDDYIDTAVRLTADVEAVNAIRQQLRSRLNNSAFMDYRKITEEVESGYRCMLVNLFNHSGSVHYF